MTLDRLVPRCHVGPGTGWLGDPNGPVHWRGRHHLFFQANPHAPRWDTPVWGHVSSADLVHWTRHPVALAPTPDSADGDGCWSGCVRVVDGRPVAFYTGVTGTTDADRVEAVCAAAGSDDLLTWEKTRAPLVPAAAPGVSRDPFVWQDEDGWHLVVAGEGAIEHYGSADAAHWSYTGPFFSDPDGLVGGRHWECPQLLRYDGVDVLVLSVPGGTPERPRGHVVHLVGRAHGGRFTGKLAGPLEHGDALYAPAAAQDGAGRWLLWGWVRDDLPAEQAEGLAQVGALSLPMVAELVGGRLVLRPAPELAALRGPGGRCALRVRADGRQAIGRAERQLEVAVTVSAGGGSAAVEVELSETEAVTVRLEGARGELVVDRSRAGSEPWAPRSFVHVPVEAARAAAGVRLRLLVDGSLLVVLLDDALAAVVRVYPTGPGEGDVLVDCAGDGRVDDCSLHRLTGVAVS